MQLKEKLRKYRKDCGLSQEKLAEKVNVSRQTIYKWEHGTAYPSSTNLEALSKIFGIPMDVLVNDNWMPPDEKPLEIQTEEIPIVPSTFQSKNNLFWPLLVAFVLAIGIAVSVIVFREQPEDSVPISTLEGEVIDFSLEDTIVLLPPID